MPRLILQYYGSDVNGLVSSITQFLQIIAFLELGVGAVVQSSLYKPLANKNEIETSKIIVSAQRFFRRLAIILLVYVVFLFFVYPQFVEFDFFYTAILILAMCISTFAQYYFGVVDRLLLTADQRGYIQYNAQTATLLLNTVVCAIMIYFGASIHIVKLTTSLIYLIRPVVLRLYVNRRYKLNRHIKYDSEPIKQKWNGVAQHISAVVLDSTDSIVLTLFSTLSSVSVYTVYHLVIYGIKQLFTSMTNGIQSLLGELWARQEIKELEKTFSWTEWCIHTGATFLFGCTGSLIVPFVMVYTNGINDANYVVPAFAILITIAHAMHCLRLPYNMMILAGGHYKQTQHNYIIAAIINIVVSIAVVSVWGLIGVAIGTLAAMLYQTIWMAYYNSKNFIKWKFKRFAKQLVIDSVTFVIGYFAAGFIKLGDVSYISWIWMAIPVVAIWVAVVGMINIIFYRDKIVQFIKTVKKRFPK
ncbi:MAG: lipopolysaccharide biosynthesis protein [Acutalibacteraceae bacterium]